MSTHRGAYGWLTTITLCCVSACGDMGGTEPPALAFIGVAPVFQEEEATTVRELAAYDLVIDHLRLKLKYENGEIAIDTVFAIEAGQDSVVIDVAVPMPRAQELFQAFVFLLDSDVVLFAGSQEILAKRGGDLTSRPPAIEMTYQGPGAAATVLDIGPADTTIMASDSIAFNGRAFDDAGSVVNGLAVAWSVADNRGTISPTGVFRPSGSKGSAYVIGRLPTGLRDSTLVQFVPILK
jgi:hypothetical protein